MAIMTAMLTLSMANGERPFIVALLLIGGFSAAAAFLDFQSAFTIKTLDGRSGWSIATIFGRRLGTIAILLVIVWTVWSVLRREGYKHVD